MLLNMHFQKYRYNFENCTYIIVNGTGIEIKHKNFQLRSVKTNSWLIKPQLLATDLYIESWLQFRYRQCFFDLLGLVPYYYAALPSFKNT